MAVINDPNVAANIAAVKAASTAPVATDPALVVAISPNSAALAQTVAGAKSNNAVVPGATNLGTLPAVANAAAPTDTETFQVALSVDLAGTLRSEVTKVAGTATATAAAGVQKVGTVGSAGAAYDAVAGAAAPANVLFSSIAQIGATAASTAAAGVLKVGIVGNANGAIDGAIAAAPPANALQIGLKTATANPTNASAGNQVAIMGDKAGRLVVTPGNVRELVAAQTVVITASTAETTIITAGGANVFNDLSALIITTTNGAAAVITIKDATAGTTRLTFNYPNAALAPSDALMISFPVPISQATSNANWTATVSVNAGSTSFSCVFVKNL